MWDSGVHINCFYEWWNTKEYRIDFHNEQIKADFLHEINTKKGWIWDRLRWLRDEKCLDAEQLYWYWNKYDKYIDKDLIKQEYPCTPHEAFLLSGTNVFSTEAILRRLENLTPPLKVGYFTYDYDGLKITNIKWVNDKNGYVKLFVLPSQLAFTKMAIGGDTAGDGSDFFTAHCIDVKTGIQVAKFKHRFDADQYTRQIYCLGRYYNDALIGIEANFDSYPLRELQRLGYPNQYVREVQDTYTGKTEKRFGFKTTSLTRPTIISRLVEIVREHCDKINDRETLEELLTIIKNEKGRIEAPEGGHDDEMMGLSIAYEVGNQVVIPIETIITPSQHHFDIQRQMQKPYDYGETRRII
jgi:hypothetical protein